MEPGSPSHNDLSGINFNDRTRSVSSCLKPNEISGGTLSLCRDIKLFFGRDFIQIRSQSNLANVLGYVGSGTSIAVSATPAAVITPLINGFTFVIGLFKELSDADEAKYREANIDLKITKSHAASAQSDIKHCKDYLSSMDLVTKNLIFPPYVRDIEYCFHRMSTVLNLFEDGVLRDHPLVSSPYFVAFTPILLMTHRLTLQVSYNVILFNTT